MRKNELIKQLQQIKGNPEVCVWYGLVDDYQKIKAISQHTLYRPSKKIQLKYYNFERYRDGLPELTLDEFMPVKNDYEFPSSFLTDEEMKRLYDQRKKVIIIEPKTRNKTLLDRMGVTQY